jgi:hypothetical protein
MFAEVRADTNQIVALGRVMGPSVDPARIVVELTPAQADALTPIPLGAIYLNPDGTITVIPPPPPPPPSPLPDYGDDATPDQTQLVQAVSALRTYLATATPTAAQSATALKLLIRVVFFLTKRVIGG